MSCLYWFIKTAVKILCFLLSSTLKISGSFENPSFLKSIKSYLNDLKGIKVGTNFFLAFCPERIAEGRSLKELAEIPQIVGGVDRASSKRAAEFFKNLKIEVNISDDISAELAKLFTNMYRYISFAMANEFMVIAESFYRNIYEIIDLVNKDYKRGGLWYD